MANAKSRVKAPKSAPTRKGRRNSKQSLTGAKHASEPSASSAKKNSVVMGRPNLKQIKNEEVQLLFQNDKLDNLVKDKIDNKFPPMSLRPKNHEPKKSLAKRKLPKRSQIVTKSGRIRKKSKGKLKLIDNILKSELMIERNTTLRSDKSTPSVQSANNNNELGISNQNSTTKTSNTVKGGDKKKSENKVKRNSPNVNNYDKLESDSKKSKQKTVNKKTKVNDKNVSKTKQVTLSNGLVLTLTLFQCDHCKKMFSNKSSMRRHIYSHINLKPHVCKKCSKKFRTKTILQNHINKFHSEVNEPFLCNICDKTFKLEENLCLHIASHIKNENSYKCVYCNKKFSYHLLLLQHEKQHQVTGRYQCTICNMSYDCRNRLSLHVKSHLKIKDYICQYCGKEFLRMNSMRRHVQICHGGHRIQCPICMKKLKGHLTEHMRTHKQARPHACEQCGQRFTQSTQLTVHRRSHTGARPYICRICSRPFSHSNALMLHIRRHTGEKPFPCAMCPMSFSQLPHMKAHMRNIHGKENPYKCPKAACEQFFKLKSQVDTHAKTCTVGERELTFEEKIQASVQYEEVEVASIMTLSRMRFLLALLLTMVANKEKLKFLGNYTQLPPIDSALKTIETHYAFVKIHQ